MTVVDTHSHLIPAPLLELLARGQHPTVSTETSEGATWIRYRGQGGFPVTPALRGDLETKLREMDRQGVDIALESVAAPLFLYELTPSECADMSAAINDAIAGLSRESGGRIRGVATLPMNDPPAAAAELRRAREELGLVAAQIGTSVGAVMLDDARFEPVFSAAEELRMPLMLHPYMSMMGEQRPPGLDDFFLSNSVGNALETLTAAGRLILGGALDRHPALRLQLAHGGGAFPYQLPRLDRSYALRPAARAVARRRPLEYLDNFLFDTIVFDRRTLEFLIATVGVDRVVFGSDGPFDTADFAALELRNDDPDAADAVLGENARRAYSL